MKLELDESELLAVVWSPVVFIVLVAFMFVLYTCDKHTNPNSPLQDSTRESK